MRWGNVAQLAALVAAVALIAFGAPDGCGSEPESIPLDALPGEPVEVVLPRLPRLSAALPPRVQHQPRLVRRREERLGREAVAAASPVARVPRVAALRPTRRRAPIPETAREFSFDR